MILCWRLTGRQLVAGRQVPAGTCSVAWRGRGGRVQLGCLSKHDGVLSTKSSGVLFFSACLLQAGE